MPLYLCRWPNGDCSVVRAANKREAVDLLDEVDNAEGCPLVRLSSLMIHFHLSDEGELEFDGFGEDTEHALFDLAYPVLHEASMNAPTNDAGTHTSEGLAVISDAIAKERKRVHLKKVREPKTELGRDMKKQMRAPTRIIERIVRESATRTLQQFPAKVKPN